MKRLISIILLMAMLLCTLVACGGGDGDGKDTTPADVGGNGGEGGEGGDDTTAADTTDYFEAQDLDGYTFRYLMAGTGGGDKFTYDVDELDDNIANQARIKRDSEIKDRFNVVLEDVYSGTNGNICNYVVLDAMLTEASFDIGKVNDSENAAVIITNQASYDVKELPHVDTSKEWYNQQSNDEFTVMNRQYFFSSMFIGLPGASSFIFNKDMITELGLEQPYDLMFAGDWTMEKFKEYVSVGYVDTDGTTGASDGDNFGYSGHSRSLPYFFWGFGESNTDRDENGAVIPVLANERMDAIYNVLQDFKRDQAVFMNSSLEKENPNSSHRIFYDGRSIFCYWITGSIKWTDIETFEYGLGILPKYDEDQEHYHNPAVGGLMLVACNPADPEKTGLILEAGNEASYRITYPATIQEAIKYETYCDEESIEMRKLCDKYLGYDILAYVDPTGGQLANCMFMNTCLDSNTTPSVLAMGAKDGIELMFHNFFYGDN